MRGGASASHCLLPMYCCTTRAVVLHFRIRRFESTGRLAHLAPEEGKQSGRNMEKHPKASKSVSRDWCRWGSRTLSGIGKTTMGAIGEGIVADYGSGAHSWVVMPRACVWRER